MKLLEVDVADSTWLTVICWTDHVEVSQSELVTWSASGIVSGGGSETWNEIWNESARNLENENGGGTHDERPCLQSVWCDGHLGQCCPTSRWLFSSRNTKRTRPLWNQKKVLVKFLKFRLPSSDKNCWVEFKIWVVFGKIENWSRLKSEKCLPFISVLLVGIGVRNFTSLSHIVLKILQIIKKYLMICGYLKLSGATAWDV